jgi:hypothetical protein
MPHPIQMAEYAELDAVVRTVIVAVTGSTAIRPGWIAIAPASTIGSVPVFFTASVVSGPLPTIEDDCVVALPLMS